MRELNSKEMLKASGGETSTTQLLGMYLGYHACEGLFAAGTVAAGGYDFSKYAGPLLGLIAGRQLATAFDKASENWVDPYVDQGLHMAKVA